MVRTADSAEEKRGMWERKGEETVLRSECPHPFVGTRDHRCPTCRGTMRRCCDSLVGLAHRKDCHEVLERG